MPTGSRTLILGMKEPDQSDERILWIDGGKGEVGPITGALPNGATLSGIGDAIRPKGLYLNQSSKQYFVSPSFSKIPLNRTDISFSLPRSSVTKTERKS